jgi:hypothetical protein
MISMNRREFARNVVGAIVGVSAIPEFGSKPSPMWFRSRIHVHQPNLWPPILETLQLFPKTNIAEWVPYIRKDPPPDISIADKLRIRDMLG